MPAACRSRAWPNRAAPHDPGLDFRGRRRDLCSQPFRDVDRIGPPRVTAAASKKLFIKTWGCQMNVYDSGRMADILAPLGYALADRPEGADMVILNTCHIREKATEKVFSDLGRLRPLKEAKEDRKSTRLNSSH